MTKLITHLEPNEVFIFGSNSTGFHGAGAAGYAFRGTSANTWRTCPLVDKARRAAVDSPDRVGKWTVWGKARGWSRGHEGMSYAIETIKHPGQKRSTPPHEIQSQFVELFHFCDEHPEWFFLMTPVGASLAGYSEEEMFDILWAALKQDNRLWDDGNDGINAPDNLVIPIDLYGVNWSMP